MFSRPLLRTMIWALLLGMLIVAVAGMRTAPLPDGQAVDRPAGPIAAAAPLSSLDSLVSADGRLDLSGGVQGSVQTEGWRVRVGEDGQPRFLRPNVGQPTLPGDEYWDDRFDLSGTSSQVRAAVVTGTAVFLAGLFRSAGDTAARWVVRYETTTGEWTSLGYGISCSNCGSTDWALAVHGSSLYVGGFFNAICSTPGCYGPITGGGINNVARFDLVSGTWSPLANGLNGPVAALAVRDSVVYAGGSFSARCTNANCSATEANGVNSIARFNGTEWLPLSSGLPNQVRALAIDSAGIVYAGGFFIGSGLNAVGRWDPMSPSWQPLANGLFGAVYTLAFSGTVLYAGGDFASRCNDAACMTQSANGVNRVAQFSSGEWLPVANGLGPNVAGQGVRSLAVISSTLYAGGTFEHACQNATCVGPPGTPIQRIARFDGAAWQPVGHGVHAANSFAEVYAVFPMSSTVGVAGFFNRRCTAPDCLTIGPEHFGNIAWLNGNIWQPLLAGNSPDRDVNALAIAGDTLYLGGAFRKIGSLDVSRIARYSFSTNTWLNLGFGLNDEIRTIVISGTEVIAGGRFTERCLNAACTSTDQNGVNRIARFDGANWLPYGNGLSNTVQALTVLGGQLVAGGEFTGRCLNPACSSAAAEGQRGVARFDGSTWQPLAFGFGPVVRVSSLAVVNNQLLAGGFFSGSCPSLACPAANANGTSNIARFDGAAWQPLGKGLAGGDVFAIAEASDGTIIAGGQFISRCIDDACTFPAGQESNGVNRIARFTASTWEPIGLGFNDYVRSIVPVGNTIVVGGEFEELCSNLSCTTQIDGPKYVAMYSGGAWRPFGSGTDGDVLSLVGAGSGSIVIGGEFVVAGPHASGFVGRYREHSDLGVRVAAGGPVALGSPVTVTSVVTSTGPFAAFASLTTTLPAGAALGAVSPSRGACLGAGPVVCQIPALSPGEVVTVSFTITPSLAGTTSVTSTVSALQLDPLPSNNSASASLTVNAATATPSPSASPTPTPVVTATPTGTSGPRQTFLPAGGRNW